RCNGKKSMSWENTVRPSFIDHSFPARGMAVEYRKLQIDYDGFHLQFLRTWLLTENFVPNVRTLLIWNINLIGYGRRNWRRLINASCPTISGSPSGQLPRRPETIRG